MSRPANKPRGSKSLDKDQEHLQQRFSFLFLPLLESPSQLGFSALLSCPPIIFDCWFSRWSSAPSLCPSLPWRPITGTCGASRVSAVMADFGGCAFVASTSRDVSPFRKQSKEEVGGYARMRETSLCLFMADETLLPWCDTSRLLDWGDCQFQRCIRTSDWMSVGITETDNQLSSKTVEGGEFRVKLTCLIWLILHEERHEPYTRLSLIYCLLLKVSFKWWKRSSWEESATMTSFLGIVSEGIWKSFAVKALTGLGELAAKNGPCNAHPSERNFLIKSNDSATSKWGSDRLLVISTDGGRGGGGGI